MSLVCMSCPLFHRKVWITEDGGLSYCYCENHHTFSSGFTFSVPESNNDAGECMEKAVRKFGENVEKRISEGWRGCDMLAERMLSDIYGEELGDGS